MPNTVAAVRYVTEGQLGSLSISIIFEADEYGKPQEEYCQAYFWRQN